MYLYVYLYVVVFFTGVRPNPLFCYLFVFGLKVEISWNGVRFFSLLVPTYTVVLIVQLLILSLSISGRLDSTALGEQQWV